MRKSGVRAALLIICLCLAGVSAVVTAMTPQPRSATAPGDLFSAERAMVDDRVIAKAPHPEGSPAAQAARDYIVGRMEALGLHPRRLRGQAVEALPRFKGLYAAGGQVENLLGLLPGQDLNAPAILLMAHSDSVPGSPGAADDAAGVVSILEIVRALEVLGPRRRSILVLITDGEEVGLLGARAFFQSGDPRLKHIGMVINLEARGGGGRVAMFETGARNGDAMAFFAQHVGSSDALSLMSEVYKYMPNSTDFTVAKKAGFAGYNFAFVGREFDYHSPSSTPAVLDRGSLQHMGDQVLALTRGLAAAATLPTAKPDAVYADVLGGPVISYAPTVQWGLLTASLLLALFGAVRGAGAAAETLSAREVLRGTAAGLCPLFAAALALHLANQALGDDPVRHRGLMAQFPLVFTGMSLLTIGAALFAWRTAFGARGRRLLAGLSLAAVLAVSLIAGVDGFGLVLGAAALATAAALGRPLSPWNGWLGAFLAVFVVTFALQMAAPPLTIATAWPLFLSAGLLFVCGRFGGGDFGAAACLVFAALAALVCVSQLGHLASMIFTGVGLEAPEALALVAFTGAPALYPLLDGFSKQRWAPAVILLATLGAVGFLGAAAGRNPWTERTPEPVQAFYLQDAASGQAWRADGFPNLDPWSQRVLKEAGAPVTRRPMAPAFDRLYRASAPVTPLERPTVLTHVEARGRQRVVSIQLAPRAFGRQLRLFFQPTERLRNLKINGEAVDLEPRPGAWARLVWADPGSGLDLTFDASAKGGLDLRYNEIIDGWPRGVTVPPKDPAQMPWGLSDTTVLADQTHIQW